MTSRWFAVAALAAVFFAGIAAALATLRVVEHRRGPAWQVERGAFWRGEPPRRSGRPSSPLDAPPLRELAHARVADAMARRLGLTEEQRTRIEEAMERRRAASQETMNRILPALQSQMDSLNAEIESILDPEQREAFRAFQSADRERFRRRGPGGGRMRDGGPLR